MRRRVAAWMQKIQPVWRPALHSFLNLRISSKVLDSAECAVFHHAAISCESKWISKRSYWSRIFFSLGSNREEEKNPGMVARRAFAATSSDGGSAGFMVLSQLLKQSQTSAV